MPATRTLFVSDSWVNVIRLLLSTVLCTSGHRVCCVAGVVQCTCCSSRKSLAVGMLAYCRYERLHDPAYLS